MDRPGCGSSVSRQSGQALCQKVATFVAENQQRARELALVERVVRVKNAFSTLGNLVPRLKPIPQGAFSAQAFRQG